MNIWQLGNTSVRSVMRIRDGLIAYSTSNIQGNIRNTSGDIAFRKLLGECGIITLGEDATNSVGRKWRAAMEKLGFLYPYIKIDSSKKKIEIGPVDMITPSGWNLIKAESVAAMQECYLRAMVTPLTAVQDYTFSPVCWTLALLLELEQRGIDPEVSFLEMACIIQATTPLDGVSNAVNQILALRNRRDNADRKRQFDQHEYSSKAKTLNCNPHTLRDYADMNIRYLKATGMVRAKGKGIALVPEKHALALALTRELLVNRSKIELYQSLCQGTELPTDDATIAFQALTELKMQLQQYHIDYSTENKPLSTAAEINLVRYEIEELIARKKEEFYAQEQVKQWREIIAYMDLLITRKEHQKVSDESEIRVPRAEAPAYLEWVIWRAFLAIDSLVNKPYEVRRFKIDQDFLPVCTAPGNGPDLVAEFEDCIIVIEVTLSENSRQEAMEGEPVRRHVAELAQKNIKPVYGLFIANRVDSNTAETFRIGVWYTNDDLRMELHIVPFTLTQFRSFFNAMFKLGRNIKPETVIDLIKKCERYRTICDAPLWKKKIEEIVDVTVSEDLYL